MLLSNSTYIKWLSLFIVYIIFAAWDWRRHQTLSRRISKNQASSPLPVLAVAQQRFWLMTALFVLGWASMVRYDMLQARMQQEEPSMEIFPALTHAANPVTDPVPSTASATLIEDIFEPVDASGLPQNLDDLKQRYEESLVSFFYMRRCGLANPQDYHIILSALMQELAALNAPSGIQKDIVLAARGSYNELYIRSPCNADSIHALYEQYSNYVAQLTRLVPQP